MKTRQGHDHSHVRNALLSQGAGQKSASPHQGCAMQLERRMEFGEVPPVITAPGQPFKLSFFINKTPRTMHGEKQCIIPYEEFQRMWGANLKLADNFVGRGGQGYFCCGPSSA